jgi:hypothetical protein
VSAILGSFLEHLSREKALRRQHGSKVVTYLLDHWRSLASWWEGPFVADRRLAAVGVLKKMFSVESEVRKTGY